MSSIHLKNLIIDDIETAFGLQEVASLSALSEWIESTPPLTSNQLSFLSTVQSIARRFEHIWTPTERSLSFIYPMFNAVKYGSTNYRGFAARNCRLTAEGLNITGKVDFCVGTGKAQPKEVYFLFHQYDPAGGQLYDPRTQLIASMLAVRQRKVNQHELTPVYGCYVIGQSWFFVVLQGDRYATSLAYNSTRPEQLRTAFNALAQVKIYIEQLLQEPAL